MELLFTPELLLRSGFKLLLLSGCSALGWFSSVFIGDDQLFWNAGRNILFGNSVLLSGVPKLVAIKQPRASKFNHTFFN